MEKKQPKYRILIVEDETAYRSLLQSVLRLAGHHSTACMNGDQAIEKLKKERFDVIIIDYLLPGPNALEIIQWARTANIKTPAMIITSYPSDTLESQCRSIENTILLRKMDIDIASFPSLIETTFASTFKKP